MLEARARAVSASLRCVVCQNQSIDDSDAPLAHDLRVLVRERIVAGDSDAQATQYLVDRYGHYVLLKPPFEPATLFLWLGPALVLVAGASGHRPVPPPPRGGDGGRARRRRGGRGRPPARRTPVTLL